MGKRSERDKAAFITAYRFLCEQHGMFVIWVEEPENYAAFTVARMDKRTFEDSLNEMLLQPLVNVCTE